MCAYNVCIRAFEGCCGSLFVREPMEGVNALYLRVSGIFCHIVCMPFVFVYFLLLVFSSLYACECVCVCEYVCKCICGECVCMLRVPIWYCVRLWVV